LQGGAPKARIEKKGKNRREKGKRPKQGADPTPGFGEGKFVEKGGKVPFGEKNGGVGQKKKNGTRGSPSCGGGGGVSRERTGGPVLKKKKWGGFRLRQGVF